jgi:predicted ATP-grasp superfamily ATP-dependent carboligase
MAQSFYDPELNAIGLKLLTPLNWHGVAMVEFKKDTRDNKLN